MDKQGVKLIEYLDTQWKFIILNASQVPNLCEKLQKYLDYFYFLSS